jgi:predicted permease
MHPDRWWNVARLRLRSLTRRQTVESELERELRFHLEREAAENVGRGLAPSEARLAATRRLGGVAQIQEECRDMRRTAYIENFIGDLRYAARTLLKTPGFAVVIVLTLALAIGANSAIFSVIDGVLLRPLPYPRADRIVRVEARSRNYPKFPLNPWDLQDIRARNRSFGAIAGITRSDRQLSGAGRPERLACFRITAGYFRVLGVSPAIGREFTTEDELPARGNQVILSDRVWRTRFAADPSIVSRAIMLDAEPYTVAGVMPPVAHPGNYYHSVADGDTVDIWTPFPYDPHDRSRGSHYMEVFARLKDGVTLSQARSDMDAQFAQLSREHPGNMRGWQSLVVPLHQETVGSSRRLLLVLLGAVGLVLLIACANAANLLLARASVRQREIAVRSALGAARSRLVRQMLAESLLIAITGGVFGSLLAVGGVRVLTALLPADFPRASAIHVNGIVFAFTLVVALATGFLFGLAPAVQAARTDLQHALREGGRGSSAGRRQLHLRNILVVGELALACILLVGAGLMLRSFVNLLRTDPGFRSDRVVTAAVSLPYAKYKSPKDGLAFYERLNRSLAALPGIRVAGLGSDLPWTGYDENISGFTIEGKQPPPGQDFHARFHLASEDYFRALGIPLVRGRFFTAHDNMTEFKGPVIVVNREMAEAYWPGEDAIGKRVTFDDNPKEADWNTVVGIVGDVKDNPGSAGAVPALWWPIAQMPVYPDEMVIVARANADPAAVSSEIRSAVAGLDPQLAVAKLKMMEEVAGQSFSTARFSLFLVALFAVLAATLAAIGIYGVISYSVSRRTQEFGLRVALGAKPWDVVRQVLAQGMRLAVAGVLLGTIGAMALGRVLWSLLYQVSPSDPATIAAAAVAALCAAALACYLPARRATSADPMTALRSE